MKTPVKIGERNFSSKKEALTHYKNILNSYTFGSSLNDNDFWDLMALLNYEYQLNSMQQIHIEAEENDEIKAENIEGEIFVKDIKVSKVQFTTKCFEVFHSDGTSCYISYLMMINRKEYTPESLFTIACRNCIQKDLISIKQEYFRNNSVQGRVKCQETNILSKWEELAVDHRQPNTLSIIIDRFKEVNEIILEDIEYQSNKENLIIFRNQELMQKFISYHRKKATLRVVRKERNSSRSAMGRVKKSSKDLIISQTQLPLF